MILNEYGQIAYNEWTQLTERFPYFELDVFQIMPNHMHGIILLTEPVGATLAVALNDAVVPNDVVGQNGIGAIVGNKNDAVTQNIQYDAIAQKRAVAQERAGASPAPAAAGDIVGAYKSLVANGCLEIFKHNHIMAGFTPDNIPMMGKLWQRNYYEHIIRDEQSYRRIAEYIINNPAKWNEDKFFKK
jgi:REP element-mobilizing transposase RayT